MNFENIHRIYFLGIGGIGMSALARYFLAGGFEVAGYDKTSTHLTDQLIVEGCQVHFTENPNDIPVSFSSLAQKDSTLIIYTPAVSKDHAEMKFFEANNYHIMKRSEVLGLISAKLKTIAIAGTHGKTTVSALLAHILKQSETDCTAFLGGILKNYDSNLLFGSGEMAVVEADEFDRSFLHLTPFAAIITSIDPDHLDIYKDRLNLLRSFSLFVGKIKKGGKLLLKKGIDIPLSEDQITDLDILSYSLDSVADFYAKNIQLIEGYYVFDVVIPGGLVEELRLGMPGKINIENAVAAVSMAWILGIPKEIIRKSLLGFRGIQRRFDFRFEHPDIVYIDDYAHHPVELNSFIQSVKQLFPGKDLTGVFQPHLFSRTRDLYIDFAKSLESLDELILLEIYPAREKEIEGVSSKMILDEVGIKRKAILNKDQVLDYVREIKTDVLLTMGAGDIDALTEPIVKILEERKKFD